MYLRPRVFFFILYIKHIFYRYHLYILHTKATIQKKNVKVERKINRKIPRTKKIIKYIYSKIYSISHEPARRDDML